MGAQQQLLAVAILAIDIEGVLHRARRMILRAVQCGKVGPVGFDFGAVSHVETDRTENFFDTLPRAHHRMDTAYATAAARQGDVDRFGIQTLLHLCVGQGITARCQRGFDLLFGLVDDCALDFAFVRSQFAQPLHLLGDLTGLAEILGLRIFKRGGIDSGNEISLGLRY